MRIDHHAYQRATRVAFLGLLLQFGIGLTLLLFGLFSTDAAFQFASIYVLAGILAWLGLIVIFHQHKLERLESLEEDELALTRGGRSGGKAGAAEAGAFFDRTGDESRVAARRLAMMHKWFMPALSIILAIALAAMAWWLIRYMSGVRTGARVFTMTQERGWAVAICLGAAAFSFVFSRFIAGMAKQTVWQNLRGGAAYMVGNALVLVAVATGIIFRFFENESVIKVIAWAIPVFMTALALEIVLNFILNLYRPRIPGEVPRPAFDSKVLSLLATPDSIVRSLNEAVNYQFGFDVTSSWGYQLLLRSFVWLLALGVLAMILLSMMVVVEPHQQALKLRGGQIVGDRVHESGVMWKLPWPIETAAVYDVTRVRTLHLTAKVLQDAAVNVWSDTEPPKTDEKIEPFVVGAARASATGPSGQLAATTSVIPAMTRPDATPVLSTGTAAPSLTNGADGGATIEDRSAEFVSNFYSLVDAEIVLQYRIRKDGLLNFLGFAPETVARLKTLTDRERALRSIALAEVSAYLSRLSLDEVLSPGLSNLTAELGSRIQSALDARQTGVEVVAVDLPMLRPSGNSAPIFEDYGFNRQTRQQIVADGDRNVYTTFRQVIGDANLTDAVLTAVDEYNRLARERGAQDEKTIEQRQALEKLLTQGGGEAAQWIAAAEAERWQTVMKVRADVSRWQGELNAYRAGPELYRQRETMKIYERYMPLLRKYIIAVDPSRINIDMDLKDINQMFEFAGASEEEKTR